MRPAGRRSAMLLAGCGFGVPRKAAAALSALAGAAGFRELVPALLEELAAAADPDAALAGLASVLEAAGPELRAGTVARLGADPEARRVLLALLGSSRAFTAALVRWPEWVGAVIAAQRARTVPELSAELAAMLGAAADRAAALSALRRFRRRQTLRVAARDLAGRADHAGVTAELSAVADAVIAGALAVAGREGPAAGARLAVLALGKLGGAELNYSSDIDLLFIADRAGPAATGLAERLVRALDEPTPEGLAYRVDLRLRPEGSLGPLVAELESALAYYRERARPWERQALLKCRPVAGDAELAAAFLAGIEDFVWGSGLSLAELARAAALRAEMERAAESGGAVEVKSGVGGLRDAEFAVQLLQLAHGAEHPELRRTGTLAALAALEAAELVAPERARALRAGYEFLRRVEHCLQTMQELQLHALPAAPAELAGLARRLGYPGSSEAARAAFGRDLAAHSAALRAIYTGLCGEGAGGADLAGKLRALLAPGADENELVSLLRLMGFGAGRRAAGVLRALAGLSGSAPEQLAPVLERLRGGADPERGLANLERIARAAGGAAFLAQLATGHQPLAAAVLGIAERSDFLSGILAARPGSLAILTGEKGVRNLLCAAPEGPFRQKVPDTFFSSPPPAADPRTLAAELAAWRDAELLAIGAWDLLDDPPIEAVSARLSELAEAEIGLALAAAAVGPEVVVLALGKLGGREMSYGSDLDLVLVAAGEEAAEGRAAQEAVRALEASGRPVDVRLRPAGSKGPLVASLAGYRAYRDRGELAGWERLALVRARPVAGAAAARAAVLDFLGETLYAAEPPANLAAEVWEMRVRLEGTAEAGDFKRGSGGLVDLEFLAQYLALAHGWHEPAVRLTGTEATFQAAAAARILPAAEARKALAAHRFLRRLEMRARVLEGRPVKSLPADPAALDSLARRMKLVSGQTLRAEFEAHTAAARALLERTLGV